MISSNAKDLVLKMLAPNPHNRLTIEEVLEHPWMRVTSTFLNCLFKNNAKLSLHINYNIIIMYLNLFKGPR